MIPARSRWCWITPSARCCSAAPRCPGWQVSAAGQAAATLISEQAVYLHHGLYAYTAATLRRWHRLKTGKLEQLESLEQLRLLENGLAISMLVSALDHAELMRLRGVDTAADLQRVRALLS